MGFQVSPGVDIREIDLTNVIPAVSTTVGGIAMRSVWGPVDEIVLVDSENMLVDVFGKPNNDNYKGWFSAANFLSYGNALRVVRVIESDTARNANYGRIDGGNTGADELVDSTSYETTGSSSIYVSNEQDLEDQRNGTTLAGTDILAKYPGVLGNSIRIAMYNNPEAHATGNFIDADGASAGTTENTLSSVFDTKPNNQVGGGEAGSDYVTERGGGQDEINVLVIDHNGEFTGVPGTILEKYELLSLAHDAKSSDGSSNYIVDVINGSSSYIAIGKGLAWGNVAIDDSTNDSTKTYIYGTYLVDLAYGNEGSTPEPGDYYLAEADGRGYRLLEDAETVDVSLLIYGGADEESDTIPTDGSPGVISQRLVEIAEARKDCVAFISPAWWTVDPRNTTTESDRAANIISWRNNDWNKSSSYAVVDSGYKYQYDAYNDVYRWVPLNGDVAGLCVRTDGVADPWFSPAGYNRGQINRVVKLAHNPRQAHRDDLYQAGINPVVAFPGQGTILFGDKTALAKPSAFDRINVRRLFIVLEKAIATASKFQLFELNDQFTRSQFVAMVNPFLRDVKGRRGIFDFKVVCDSSNNTPEVIDTNRFVADIFIKPARSINFMQLNFIATRTGASFSEVAGAV
jgi:hypothetical protein